MIGALLPVVLLFTTLALYLGFVPRRGVLPAIAVLIVASTAAFFIMARMPGHEAALPILWAWVIVIAASIHFTATRRVAVAIAFAGAAGATSGWLVAAQGHPSDLIVALPCILLCVPARLIVARGWSIAIRIVASWLIAVAMLVALLPLVHTPGYVPDHME